MRRTGNLTTFMCRLSWNLGASSFWDSQGLSRPVMGLLYLYYYSTITTTTCTTTTTTTNNNNNNDYYYYYYKIVLQFRARTSVPWRILANNLVPCQPYYSYYFKVWALLFCVLWLWIIMFPFFAEAKTRLTYTFRSLIHNSVCSDPSWSPDPLSLLFSIERFRHRLLRACLVSSVLWIFTVPREGAETLPPYGSV
jgi:hypothetical protein